MVRISELKESNIKKVRVCFYKGGEWVKNDLAEVTGLSLAAITNILQYLVKNGEIVFVGFAESSVGRKAKRYQINPDYHHYAMIQCQANGTNTLTISRYSLSSELLDRQCLEKVITKDEIVRYGQQLLDNDPLIKLIMISVPGICCNGRIESSPIRGIVGLDLANYLSSQLNCRVVIENEVTFKALGFDASEDRSSSIYVQQLKDGTMRSVFILDHEVLKGATSYAGTLITSDEDGIAELIHQVTLINALIDPVVIGVDSCFAGQIDERELLTGIPIYHRSMIKIVTEDYFEEGVRVLVRALLCQ